MSDLLDRYRHLADGFTARVEAVPSGAWDNPSPCEDWTARDVVRHLTEWITAFFSPKGVEFPALPSVDDDPVGAWEGVQAAIARALADLFKPTKMNYEIHGNTVPHLHMHLYPRYQGDPYQGGPIDNRARFSRTAEEIEAIRWAVASAWARDGSAGDGQG